MQRAIDQATLQLRELQRERDLEMSRKIGLAKMPSPRLSPRSPPEPPSAAFNLSSSPPLQSDPSPVYVPTPQYPKNSMSSPPMPKALLCQPPTTNADLSTEENVTLEELENFARDFKQQRIKLGYTQVLYSHIASRFLNLDSKIS